MAAEMKSYDIHSILKVNLNIPFLSIHKRFNIGRPCPNPDIRILKGNTDISGRKVESNFYWSGESLLHKGIGKILLEDLFGKPKIIADGRAILTHIISISSLARLAIQIQLLKKGYALVHSAAISEGEKGYVLSGWGESGKTENVLAFVNRGFKLLADEYVILKGDGSALSYPTPFVIGPDTRKENVNLSISKKVESFIRNWLNKATFEKIPLCSGVGIEPEDVAEINDECLVKKVFILRRGGKDTKRISSGRGIRHILATTKHDMLEDSFARKFLYLYCYLSERDVNWIDRSLRSVLEGFEGKEYYMVKDMNRRHFESIQEVIS